VQFTVRLSRRAATGLAILSALVAMVVLPASASSDTTISVCVDPATFVLSFSQCGGQVVSWNQSGVPGTAGAAGAAGATGPAGPRGPAGPATHLDKTHPALAAQIQAALVVQAGVLTDVNDSVRTGLATMKKLPPSTDPTVKALQAQVAAQGAAINKLVNVLRALSKAQSQLVSGLE
jgi:hypothetical protein